MSSAEPVTGRTGILSARSWAPPLAWGAGLIQAAMGAAAITAGGDAAALALGAGMLLLGVAALGWGAASLARGRLVAPRAATATAALGVVTLAALLLLVPRASIVGAGTVLVLLCVLGATSARARRHGDSAESAPRIGALLAAAALVTLLTTPALGAVQDAAVTQDGVTPAVSEHSGH